jgi:integrase-like protein
MSVRRRGDRWIADWYGLDGRRVRQSFRTRDAAKKAERDGIDARERGQLPVDRHRTLSDFVHEWERAVRPSVRAQTWASYDTHRRLYIEPVLGQTPLAQLICDEVCQVGVRRKPRFAGLSLSVRAGRVSAPVVSTRGQADMRGLGTA